jgi:2-desacetyl-2-hydroxyethyl bacteriochlorophyllide A dehydrogenase
MQNQTMQTVICREPGAIALGQSERPAPPPPGWVAVDIANVGICGTDYHIYEGKHPYLQYPRIMGHELSGTIAEDAEGWNKGDLVVINPYLACGTCHACLRGKPNCCYNISVLGVHRDGGLCERLNLPATNLIRAQGVNAEQAATVEFLAIGAHAVRRSEATAQDRVLVVGAGPIGIGAALFARHRGAEVHLLDTSEKRLAMVADRFGFEHAHRLSAGKDALMQVTDGFGFDVVMDATGSLGAIENGFQYVAHGGTFVLVSVVKGDISFSDAEFHKREMRLVGSRNATTEDFATVIGALATGAIDYRKLITHRTSLAELPAHFPAWTADREQMIKAMVTVR